MTDSPTTTASAADPVHRGADAKAVPDRELLRRYVRLRDEAAFAALVRRHGRLVVGVCRRVLRSEHDIEDAFQATFLVLARDAGRIRKSDSLASWLHGVAYRTSLRAADTYRRRGRLLRDLTMIEDSNEHDADNGPLAQVEQRHHQQALDEELASLPDNYRAALVLHYLDGKSNQQVADELGLSITALEGRLKRGRKELRLRLARRGIGLSVAVAAMHAVQSTAQAAPLELLIARAIDAGLSYAGGEAAGPVYTPEAARLAGQELMTMSTTSAVTLAAVVLLPLTLGFAGHEPVAGAANNGVAISTMLAQADTDVENDATVDADARDASGSRDVSADDFGNYESTIGSGFGTLGGEGLPLEDEVEERTVKSVSDVHVTTVHKDENGRTAVVITYERDGKQFRKHVWLEDDTVDTVETIESDVPEEFRIPPEASAGLNRQVSLNFTNAPFSAVIQELASSAGVNVMIDSRGLARAGIDEHAPVTIQADNVTLRSALDLVLEPLNLSWAMEDEVIRITSAQRRQSDPYKKLSYTDDDMYDDYGVPLPGSPESRPPADLVDYSDMPPSERRIADALNQPTQVEFVDTPLHDVLMFLGDSHSIPILIDEAALTDVGIPTDEPINLLLENVQLQSALNHILGRLGCTTIIRDEVLTVTTSEVADEYLVTRVYNIRQLGAIPEDQLLQVLQDSIPNAQWKQDGGGGTVAAVDGALVVTQTQAAHRQVVDLLHQLQRHAQVRPQSQTFRDADLTPEFDAEAAESQPRTPFTLQIDAGGQVRPQSQTFRDADLPPEFDAEAAESQPRTPFTLQIDAGGQVRHAGREVSSDQIRELIDTQQPALVQLNVHRDTPSRVVSDLIETLQSAGVPGLRFMMRAIERTDEAQPPASEGDMTAMPPGWEPFSSQRMTSLLDREQPVLVNFTADWCLVCQQNEAQALHTEQTSRLLASSGIIPLHADYTEGDVEIKSWLAKYGVEEPPLPLSVVYPRGEPDHPILLTGPLTQESLHRALHSALGARN